MVASGTVGIHNGIIVNDAELWRSHPDLEHRSDVDTEVLVRLLRRYFDESGDLAAATRRAFAEIQGAATIAFLFDALDVLLLATNTGSLHSIRNERNTFFAFASERFILQRLAGELGLERRLGTVRIESIPAFQARVVSLRDLSTEAFSMAAVNAPAQLPGPNGARPPSITDHTKTPANLRRCKRILPGYPFMKFDENGVCTYCRRWRPIQQRGGGAAARGRALRSQDGSPDVIVAFSGSRDSSYGLHYVKKVLGMNRWRSPTTGNGDGLGRKGQARVCGKLGVEHIIRSANMASKRPSSRKNVRRGQEARARDDDAVHRGRQAFYHYARQLRKRRASSSSSLHQEHDGTPYKTDCAGFSRTTTR